MKNNCDHCKSDDFSSYMYSEGNNMWIYLDLCIDCLREFKDKNKDIKLIKLKTEE